MPILSKKWIHKMNEQRTFIFFVGLAATLVILTVLWQGFVVQRIGISESVDDWRLKQLLPSGAVVLPGGHMPLDVPTGATVVGYSVDNRSYLTLIVSTNRGKLEAISTLDLTEVEPLVYGSPRVYAEILGPGASPAIVARMNGAFESVATAFAVVKNNKLEPVYRIDGGGNRLPAVFFNGNVIEGYENFEMKDVTGDGVSEVIVNGRYVGYADGTPGYNSSVDAYSWDQGYWVYDKQLSWALLTSNGLFPEPAFEPESGLE